MAVLDEIGTPYIASTGEAAFYGPKIDFIVRDCIGREWQLGTVQLDYVLPERFGLEYIGPDNHAHRPVMIHRRSLRLLERFLGILIEHFAGAFPLWLAPEQVRVLPISDKVADYAQAVLEALLRSRFPSHARLSAGEDRLQDSRRPAREDSRHAGRGCQGSRAADCLLPRPDRRRPGSDASVQAIARLKQEADARIVPPAAASPAPAAAEEGAEQHTY